MGYSKQWCEIWSPDTPHSFDIDSIVTQMYRGRYYPIECEGFGFRCIYKDEHGRVWLAFSGEDGNYGSWQAYNKTVIANKTKADESSRI